MKVVHCKRDSYDIYIGRPGKWGNPFDIGRDGDRKEVIAKHAAWIVTQPGLMADIHELKGKILGCWCAPKPCHGDTLITLANQCQGNKMSPTLNAKGRPFSWSYSNYKDYKNCPLKYAHNRFYCTTPFTENEANIWGNRVHTAGEMFLKGKPHDDIEALLPVEPYVTAMLRSGNTIEAELEITLTKDFKLTTWFALDAWFRIKIDVVIHTNKYSVMIYDWKTGKIREDPDQFRLAAAALSVVRPHLTNFDGKFVWVKDKVITGVRPLTKDNIAGVWQEFLPVAEKMSRAWDREDFPATPSGLCPWCAVDSCAKRRGQRKV